MGLCGRIRAMASEVPASHPASQSLSLQVQDAPSHGSVVVRPLPKGQGHTDTADPKVREDRRSK